MLGSSPTSRASIPASVPADRRRARRTSLHRNVRLVAREVDGFVLDVSRTGARIALWAIGTLEGGTILLSVDGDEPRLAVVQWARTLPDGSIVGVEFLEALGERDDDVDLDLDIQVELAGLDTFDDETAPLLASDTLIRAVPVWSVVDVPGSAPTLEEGSVRVMTCVKLVA